MLVSRRTLVQIHIGSPFSSKVMACGHCLVTLPLTINETLKWLSSLPILMQESFWWWQCSDRYKYSSFFPNFHIPFPLFSPSLISLMVSLDIKHQAYFRLYKRNKAHKNNVNIRQDNTLSHPSHSDKQACHYSFKSKIKTKTNLITYAERALCKPKHTCNYNCVTDGGVNGDGVLQSGPGQYSGHQRLWRTWAYWVSSFEYCSVCGCSSCFYCMLC